MERVRLSMPDRILVSVGRKANITQVGLDKLNIELHRNGVVVDEHMLTSAIHVYMLAVILPAFLYWHIRLFVKQKLPLIIFWE